MKGITSNDLVRNLKKITIPIGIVFALIFGFRNEIQTKVHELMQSRPEPHNRTWNSLDDLQRKLLQKFYAKYNSNHKLSNELQKQMSKIDTLQKNLSDAITTLNNNNSKNAETMKALRRVIEREIAHQISLVLNLGSTETSLAKLTSAVNKVIELSDKFVDEISFPNECIDSSQNTINVAFEGLYKNDNPAEYLQITPMMEFQYALFKLRNANTYGLPESYSVFFNERGKNKKLIEKFLIFCEHVDLRLEYIIRMNARKLSSIFCLRSGHPNSQNSFLNILNQLGEKELVYWLRQGNIELGGDSRSLWLKAGHSSAQIHVKHMNLPDFPVQNVVRSNVRFPLPVSDNAGMYPLEDNAYGKISDIFVCVKNPESSELPSSIIGILKAFDLNVRIHLLINEEASAEYEKHLLRLVSNIRHSHSINIIRVPRTTSPWLRDTSLHAQCGELTAVIEPSPSYDSQPYRTGESIIGDPELANRFVHASIPWDFEGGDMRAVGNELFIGEESLRKWCKMNRYMYTHSNGRIYEAFTWISELAKFMIHDQINASKELNEQLLASIEGNLKKEPVYTFGEKYNPRSSLTLEDAIDNYRKFLRDLFGRNVVFVGEGDEYDQPMFHIDMFLTFLPNNSEKPVVVIGDTRKTWEILNGLSPKERSKLNHEIMIEQNDWRSNINDIGENPAFQRAMSNAGAYYRNPERDRVLQEKLDAVARWFEERGYRIERIPFPPDSTGPTDDAYFYYPHSLYHPISQAHLTGNMPTFNNGLVECAQSGSRYYMPVYGCKELENAAIKVFNGLGYRVIPVSGMCDASMKSGSLNCLTTECRK